VPRPPIALLLAALASLALAAGCGDDDSGSAGDDRAGGEAQECRDAQVPAPRRDGGERRPASQLDPARTHDVTFRTSCGDFTVRLDVEQSPRAAASVAGLVRRGFYDDTSFHRIVPGFVIQGGDPTGTGMGGPGYQTVDQPPRGATYAPGVFAMAKAANDPPGAAGSQFYVVSGPQASTLPPDYAIVGEVVEGMDTVARIDAQGDPNSGGTGVPLRPVVVERATLRTS
jgi:cyclophilin family peptidyl-prolyl cis-trans isomerase